MSKGISLDQFEGLRFYFEGKGTNKSMKNWGLRFGMDWSSHVIYSVTRLFWVLYDWTRFFDCI